MHLQKAIVGLCTFSPDNNGSAVLPQCDTHQTQRALGVASRNEGFVYGPSLVGDAAPFPNGTLGNARSAADMKLWTVDRDAMDTAIGKDAALLQQAIELNDGLKSLDDYAKVLYQDQWKNANPQGVAPGVMTNYTQDLLFSMERLSQNPYNLRAFRQGENLPFEVDDALVEEISGVSLKELQARGDLFMADYRYQANLDKTTLEPKRYGAACTAYFFIHPETKDFLPLAIKTNVGKNLVYTPLDIETDWMLAKMMVNVNDLFDTQMGHLVTTHDVSEAVHQAALHTLSEKHPVMVVLERLMFQGYSSRIAAEQFCFQPGGHWDQLMYVSQAGCREYATSTWPTSGKYQAGYFKVDLKSRGLLDQDGNSPFKTFPFFQDANEIHAAFSEFFQDFVDAYYRTDFDIITDYELQNWFIEATKHAKVQDFPSRPNSKAVLVEVLTHFGFMVSVVHHTLNGGAPVDSKATLPFHIPALYAPVPEKKGVKDLLPFLPPAPNAVHYMGFVASFNRPFYNSSDRTLEEAFSNEEMLTSFNPSVSKAASTFLNSMQDLSSTIRARSFDEDGLSLGMPFIYRILDPGYIPFFGAV